MEVSDNDLSPELVTKKKKSKKIDYRVLRRYIETEFPFHKVQNVLKIVEYWKGLPAHQAEYQKLVSRLSDKDLKMLIKGINAASVVE
jgi:hypothetical protein